MRADMKKVLTERPRRGSKYGYHEVRAVIKQTDPDALPACEGMRRPHRDPKDFSDLIGPLRRYFRSSVGRHYDDVWSELCANVPGDTTVGDHLRQHAKWECDTDTRVLDGQVVSKTGFYGSEYRRPRGLYVDPRDGIIYYNEERRSNYKKPIIVDGLAYKRQNGVLYPYGERRTGRHPLKVIGDERAMQIAGIWYWIEMQDVPPPVPKNYVINGKIVQKLVPNARYDIITGEFKESGRYHADKRQMCSRDLKKHGLVNQPKIDA